MKKKKMLWESKEDKDELLMSKFSPIYSMSFSANSKKFIFKWRICGYGVCGERRIRVLESIKKERRDGREHNGGWIEIGVQAGTYSKIILQND